MKLIKLLIPLLISANLACGRQDLNKETAMANNTQTWALEKRKEEVVDVVNQTMTDYYIDEFNKYRVNWDFKPIFYLTNDKGCQDKRGLLKNKNLTKIERRKLLNKFERELKAIKFEIEWVRPVGWVTIVCPNSYNDFSELINTAMEKIRTISINNVQIGHRVLRINTAEGKVMLAGFKKLSFKFLAKVKKDYQKLYPNQNK